MRDTVPPPNSRVGEYARVEDRGKRREEVPLEHLEGRIWACEMDQLSLDDGLPKSAVREGAKRGIRVEMCR